MTRIRKMGEITIDKRYIVAGTVALVIILIAAIILYATRSKDEEKESPKPRAAASPVPVPVGRSGSPISPGVRVGVRPVFSSKRTIVSPTTSVTFNYTTDPLTDGSTGYIMYNGQKNMLLWPASIPLYFTHARLGGKIFKFRNPNSSDTYGIFVDDLGTIMNPAPSSFFNNRIELGTFF